MEYILCDFINRLIFPRYSILLFFIGGKLSKKIIPMIFKEVFLMSDKTIICKDCQQEFTFTEGEQEFYKEKGFENEPVRCPDCRRKRKAEKNSMRNNY
jgi:DNA-directed RNA polymerase subunit RPC12/RpoP